MTERYRGIAYRWEADGNKLWVHVWFPGERSQLATEALFELAGLLRDGLIEDKFEKREVRHFLWSFEHNGHPCRIVGDVPCVVEFSLNQDFWMREVERAVPTSVKVVYFFPWRPGGKGWDAWDSYTVPLWPQVRLWFPRFKMSDGSITISPRVSVVEGRKDLWEEKAALGTGYCGFRAWMRAEYNCEIAYREDAEWTFDGNMNAKLVDRGAPARSKPKRSTSVREGA